MSLHFQYNSFHLRKPLTVVSFGCFSTKRWNLLESFTSSCPPLLSSLCLVFADTHRVSKHSSFSIQKSAHFWCSWFSSSTAAPVLQFSHSAIQGLSNSKHKQISMYRNCREISTTTECNSSATIQESPCAKSQAQENPILQPTIQESSCAKS